MSTSWEIAYKCGQCSLVQRGLVNPSTRETRPPECCPECGNTSTTGWIRGSCQVVEEEYGMAGSTNGLIKNSFKETP